MINLDFFHDQAMRALSASNAARREYRRFPCVTNWLALQAAARRSRIMESAYQTAVEASRQLVERTA